MKKILIVEDEVAIREFEAINLRRVGYTTVEAGSGEEALQIFEREPDIDIALLDISMPGMDGFTLCKELRKRTETLGIIMLTARTQEMDKISGLMMGADDYITKPFSPTELLARVDSLYRREDFNKTKTLNAMVDLKNNPSIKVILELFEHLQRRTCKDFIRKVKSVNSRESFTLPKLEELKKEDLYYLCLAIINLNDKQISSLFGVSYNSIKIRKRKICSIFDIRT
ncbi:MAG: response regulator, partial [Clostridia bacterium]|nr:response regulator [Clostridia bacterium]